MWDFIVGFIGQNCNILAQQNANIWPQRNNIFQMLKSSWRGTAAHALNVSHSWFSRSVCSLQGWSPQHAVWNRALVSNQKVYKHDGLSSSDIFMYIKKFWLLKLRVWLKCAFPTFLAPGLTDGKETTLEVTRLEWCVITTFQTLITFVDSYILRTSECNEFNICVRQEPLLCYLPLQNVSHALTISWNIIYYHTPRLFFLLPQSFMNYFWWTWDNIQNFFTYWKLGLCQESKAKH